LGLEPLTSRDPCQVAGYRLRARLGAGGMGQVYLAFTPGGRPVALKMMHPQLADDSVFRRRFEHEVAAAQRVHGLYTAPVLDADPAATPPWLVTEYVPGPSLREAVRSYGPMPERTVLLLMAGVAEALDAIHAAGVIHRDLKPSNVLLAPDGPRVIDFGIARAAEATEVTGSGVRVGSAHYMAPEQVAGEPVSGATDVFALGALAVYAATGRAAFGDGPELAVMYRVRHEAPALDGCPARLRPIVEQCLAKEPAGRPSLAEVLAWCRSFTAGQTAQIAQPWLPPTLTRALSGHLPPSPVPGTPVPPGAGAPVPPRADTAVPGRGSPANSTVNVPRARRRRSRRIFRPGLVSLAVIVAALWLLADHAAGQHATGSGPAAHSPPASWLSGTWTGTADQPTGIVTRWTADLTFHGSGRAGSFRFPTLGCSGNLVVTTATRSTASVQEDLTRNSRKLCAPGGLITLTRSGTSSMTMSWRDSTDHANVATARLSAVP
jgi:serine/threonine protein kinase